MLMTQIASIKANIFSLNKVLGIVCWCQTSQRLLFAHIVDAHVSKKTNKKFARESRVWVWELFRVKVKSASHASAHVRQHCREKFTRKSLNRDSTRRKRRIGFREIFVITFSAALVIVAAIIIGAGSPVVLHNLRLFARFIAHFLTHSSQESLNYFSEFNLLASNQQKEFAQMAQNHVKRRRERRVNTKRSFFRPFTGSRCDL